MNCKKILTALLAVMMLCLAACGKAPATSDPTNAPVPEFDDSAMGMLYLSMDAEFKVTYGDDGMVLTVEPANEAGQEILTNCEIAAGTACDTAVSELVKATIANSTADLKVVLIKQAYGSEAPSAKFLEDVRVDAEAAATGCAVILVDAASLTADGYLPVEAVKNILLKTLDADEAQITVREDIANGSYFASFNNDEIIENYTIDADTGRVAYEESEPVLDSDATEETSSEGYYDPAMEESDDTEPYFEEPMTDPDEDLTQEPNFTEEATMPADF